MQPKRTKYHFATCHIHERKELVRWIQRGISNPEWIRVCSNAEHTILHNNRRTGKPKNQLDLFPKQRQSPTRSSREE